MERPNQIEYADEIIDSVQRGARKLPAAIDEIASEEVRALREDKAFRLQMIFQATLAHDHQVADALHRIDEANVDAWTEFARRSFGKLGLKLRTDVDFALLGRALHAAGEGVMFRELLPLRPARTQPDPTKLLDLIAKALIIASVDLGDEKTIDEVIDDLIERHRERRPEEVGSAS